MFVISAGLALREVQIDQVARPLGQSAVPFGQHLGQHRAGLSPGKRDEQGIEGFLQPPAGAGEQGLRLAP